MTVRLHIDAGRCMGHGRCYATAPGLLSDDEAGFVQQRGTEFEVPGDLVDQAAEAVDACPELAITILKGSS